MTIGLTVDDKNKEAVATLAGTIQRQIESATLLAANERVVVTRKKYSTIEVTHLVAVEYIYHPHDTSVATMTTL